MDIVYKKEQFNVYLMNNEYLVQNINMNNFAHTHIKNLKSCKWIIDLSLKKKVSNDINRYFLISLLRINDDKDYLKKINDLLKNKKKKEYYININKGCKKRL